MRGPAECRTLIGFVEGVPEEEYRTLDSSETPIFGSPGMASIFSPRAHVRYMLTLAMPHKHNPVDATFVNELLLAC